MNRIILIGNGFDLAHGLKTSYAHFIDWFWKKQLLIVSKDVKEWTYQSPKFIYQNEFIRVEKLHFLFDDSDKFSKDDNLQVYQKIKELKDNLDIDSFKKSISYTNKFLEKIDKNLKIKNWVDIEELYFQELVICKNHFKQGKEECDYYSIENLNKDFNAIKNELENYLDIHFNTEIENIKTQTKLTQKIHKIIWDDETKKEYNGIILFLNFNFTNTANNFYVDQTDTNNSKNKIINIHGQIKNDNNKMIFGYGDEKSEESKEIENLNNNDFLENVKSIRYTETINYGELEDFICKNKVDKTEVDKYEIIVLGHSCGNSDRTLLKMLFEADNCTKIKCYLYKNHNDKDNFQELSRNIYRSFDDKTKYRHILEKYNKDNVIPQFDDDRRHIDDFNMIEVKAGNHKIIEKENAKEKKIAKFLISKYLVTQKQWAAIMGNNPSNFKDSDDLPVECVSWYDCVSFCNKLSNKYGLTAYYNINGEKVNLNKNANGFRLPTEAEWEYAATSAGKYTANANGNEIINGSASDEYLFARNDKTNELNKLGWFWENSDSKTQPVGKKQPNELGIYDMSGNVWEWCYDPWDTTSAYRVLRGGGWYDNAECCRVSYRNFNAPDYRRDRTGFRLVLPQ